MCVVRSSFCLQYMTWRRTDSFMMIGETFFSGWWLLWVDGGVDDDAMSWWRCGWCYEWMVMWVMMLRVWVDGRMGDAMSGWWCGWWCGWWWCQLCYELMMMWMILWVDDDVWMMLWVGGDVDDNYEWMGMSSCEQQQALDTITIHASWWPSMHHDNQL